MVWEIISLPIQTGPHADAASYSISTLSCLGVKRLGLNVNHPPPSNADIKKVWNCTSASIVSLHVSLQVLYICFLYLYIFYFYLLINLLIYSLFIYVTHLINTYLFIYIYRLFIIYLFIYLVFYLLFNYLFVYIYYLCNFYLFIYLYQICGPGSSVGIATELCAAPSGIESRWRRDFMSFQISPGPTRLPVKQVPGLPGLKCCRDVLLTIHTFQCRGQGRVEIYVYPPSGLQRACDGITLPLPLFTRITQVQATTQFKTIQERVQLHFTSYLCLLEWLQG